MLNPLLFYNLCSI